jgi:hypothetical protein
MIQSSERDGDSRGTPTQAGVGPYTETVQLTKI